MSNFEPLDMAEMELESHRVNAETNENSNSFLNNFVKLPERDGYLLLRILPRQKGKKLYCATRTHRLINPSEVNPARKAKSHHCPKVLTMTDRGPAWRGECIICKYYSDLWQKSEALTGKAQEDLQNQARAIKPVERFYYNVIVRQEQQKDGTFLKNVGPKIYSCGKTVHAKILRAITGDEKAGEKPLGDISHPITGRDFRLVKKMTRSGKNEFASYDNSKFEDISVLGEPDQVEQWLANLHDLQALRLVKDEDFLKHELKVHLGLIKVEGSSDDLAEFRVGENKSDLSMETVREELVSKPVVSSDVRSDEEVLADADFMKELENSL